MAKQDLCKDVLPPPMVLKKKNCDNQTNTEETVLANTAYTVYSSAVFKPKVTRPQTKDVYARAKTYKCCACGYSHDIQKPNFPISYSNLNAGANYYLPICKTCINLLFQSIYEGLSDLHKAYRRVCMMYDIYYCDDLADLAFKSSRPDARMTTYIDKSTAVTYAQKTFADTMFEEETALNDERYSNQIFREKYVEMEEKYEPLLSCYEEEVKAHASLQAQNESLMLDNETLHESMLELNNDVEFFNQLLPDIERDLIYYITKSKYSRMCESDQGTGTGIRPESITLWGTNFEPEDYDYLDSRYKEWCETYECTTHAQEVIYQQIATIQWKIWKENTTGNGKVEGLLQRLNDFMGTAKIKPDQNKMDGLTEGQTIGTLIKKYEETRPVPESESSGISKCVSVWFFGHLCKLLGIKNDDSTAYEREKAKYDVAPPALTDDEELQPDIKFDDMFGGE